MVNARADISSKRKGLQFGLSLHLHVHLNFEYASSECTCQFVHMCRHT